MAYTSSPYKESDSLAKKRQALAELEQTKPVYTSRYGTELEELGNTLKSRGAFTYDPESDPMYGAYKDLYVQGGRRAMEDTMGKAAALTGGYGNSYAQQVGQQTYGTYLQELSEQLPQLYALALDTYTREGDVLQDQYNLLMDQQNQAYSQYLDTLDGWLNEREYLTDRYDTERDFDYQLSRDQEEDRQWQAAFDYKQWKDAQSASGSKAKSSGASGASGSSGGTTQKSQGSDGAAELEQTLAWVRDSGSSSTVKERQIQTVVDEAVSRGEITSQEGKRLVEKYTQSTTKTTPKGVSLPGGKTVTMVDLK